MASWHPAKSTARIPGRPADVYHSTELGESLFAAPTTGEFLVELLRHIEDPKTPNSSPACSNAAAAGGSNHLSRQLRRPDTGRRRGRPRQDLDAEGYMADVDRLPDGTYRLTLHSCAIWGVASHYGLACTTELEFLQEVIPEHAAVARGDPQGWRRPASAPMRSERGTSPLVSHAREPQGHPR